VRILHTSDWHLGRLFHGASLHDEQVAALDRIVAITAERAVDLVVIAGDLYDRAIPPALAIDLFDDTLVRLRDAGATVVAISGNHDSGVRVGYADQLLSRAGVNVRGAVARAADPVEVPVSDGGPPVVVYPVPYLDPIVVAHVAGSEAGGSGRFSHRDAMQWALGRARADLAARPAARSVLVAHTFVSGAQTCASERDLTVGNVEQLGLDAFAGFDYVALGHLHGEQAWDEGRIAYSGTPLPYSFSEERHTKTVRLVELDADGSRRVESIPLGVGRPLRTIRGELAELLTAPELADAEGAWVRVDLTDAVVPVQAMPKLRVRFPHAVELRHDPPPATILLRDAARGARDVREAKPLDLALRFLGEQRGVEADDDEAALLRSAFDAVQTEVAS
jgi:DNA repair protein SbcD/Mre11